MNTISPGRNSATVRPQHHNSFLRFHKCSSPGPNTWCCIGARVRKDAHTRGGTKTLRATGSSSTPISPRLAASGLQRRLKKHEPFRSYIVLLRGENEPTHLFSKRERHSTRKLCE